MSKTRHNLPPPPKPQPHPVHKHLEDLARRLANNFGIGR